MAPQLVPAAAAVNEVVLTPGSQIWHGLAGFNASEGYVTASTTHSVPH